jgi:hypothetical protein
VSSLMFCSPGPVFGGTEGIGSHFHVLCSRTHFRRNRGRRVPFSCFALPDSFSAVTRASGPIFMFCAPGLIFGGTKGVGSSFHVSRSRTSFRLYRRCRVLFSCFALPDPFSAVPTASRHIFMLCVPEPVFGGTDIIGSSFHVLRSRTRFRRYRRRRVSFSYFVLSDSFSAVPRASGPVFMLCAPEPVFGGTKDVGSNFLVLRSRTCFRRYRGRRVLFSSFAQPNALSRYRGRRVPLSCFALPDSFSAVQRASGPVFIFCALGPVFDGTEGVVNCFHVLRSRTRFQRHLVLLDSFSALPRASGPVFMFCAPGPVFAGTDGVGSSFHVLRSRTHFWRDRGRRDPFSCFALPDSLFGGTESVRSRFHILRSRTRFRR